jgi:hypothetical protein
MQPAAKIPQSEDGRQLGSAPHDDQLIAERVVAQPPAPARQSEANGLTSGPPRIDVQELADRVVAVLERRERVERERRGILSWP